MEGPPKRRSGDEKSHEASEAIRRFEAITDTALSQLSLDALLDELLGRVRQILAADTAAILLQEGDVLVARAAKGLEEEVEQGVRVRIGKGFAGRIAAERRAISIEDVAHADIQNPILRQKGIRSLLGVPLLFEGRVVGVLHVGSLTPRRFTTADAQLLQIVADRLALGIAYARLWDAERQARVRAELAERRSHLLSEVSALLATSRDQQAMLGHIARLAVPALADCCIVDVADAPGHVQRVEAYAAELHTQLHLDDLKARYPPRPERTGEFFATLRRGGSLLLPEIPASFWEELAQDAEHLRLLQQLELRSAIVAPLWAGGTLVGMLTFLAYEAGRYGESDRLLAEEIARRASAAVESVRLFRLAQEARERLSRHASRQRALAEASRVFTEARLETASVLETVVRHIAESMGDGCGIRLISADGTWLPGIALHHPDAEVREALHRVAGSIPPPAEGGVAPSLVGAAGPVLVAEVDAAELHRLLDPLCHPDVDRFPVRSLLVMPLRVQGRVTGVMVLVRLRPGPPYDADDGRLLQDVADRAAFSIERARLYGEAEQARGEAEEASRAKDEFLATVSHELRTPLAPILAWTSMLQRGALDATRAPRAIDAIGRNARSLAQLIEDLLDVSRIISGKLRLDVRPMELVSVIEAAVESMRPAADAKAIRLETDLDPDAGRVSGDPERLQQVIWNLVSNAIKFTPREGAVSVTLERAESRVQLVVRDTGKGVNAAFLPHLFERFRQADSSSTRLHGGLGLGLAIVRHLIELHGGTVSADSSGEGQGAVFTVRLPVLAVARRVTPLPSSERPRQPWPQESPVRLEGLRVLIVDDDPETCEVLGTILTEAGAAIHTCSSAAAARDEVRSWHPDVLVSDIGMPGEDGYALIRTLRTTKTEDGGRVPAIALTAYARPEDRVRALWAGFQSYVAKPIEPEELVAVVASLRPSQG